MHTEGMGSVLLRQATLDDVPRLVELNHAAYPNLIEDGVVFEASQIRAHGSVFPEGQIVALLEGGSWEPSRRSFSRGRLIRSPPTPGWA